MTSLARHAMVWLSLALAACGGSSKRTVSDGEAGEPSTGGIGGTGAGGRGGTDAQPTGGVSGDLPYGGTSGFGGNAGVGGASGAYPTMSSAELTTNGVIVHYRDIELASELICGFGTTVVKASGQPWIDDRPPCGQPYYIDDVYQENPLSLACLGCDFRRCSPFPRSHTFRTVDYVQTGYRPPPNDGAGGEGGASGEAGGAGGINEIPDIQSQIYRGPLTLTIRYYTDGRCAGDLQEQPPVTFQVGVR
jgi:hypothetical protein